MRQQPFPHLKALPEPEGQHGASAPVDQDAETLVSSFELARGDLVSLLMNLTLKDWEKRATHDTLGEVTVSDEIETHVDFDEAQVERIEQLAASR
jgi:hypothetical protein